MSVPRISRCVTICQYSARVTPFYSIIAQCKLLLNVVNPNSLLSLGQCSVAPGVRRRIVYVYISCTIVDLPFHVDLDLS